MTAKPPEGGKFEQVEPDWETTGDATKYVEVPAGIGEGEKPQMERVVKRGYAAFKTGRQPGDNPHIKRPWENFSGFKRAKQKKWAQGWKLAAVREGDYASLDAVEADSAIHTSRPRDPRKSLYSRPASSSRKPLDIHADYVYRIAGGFYPTRHDAIGATASYYHEKKGTMFEADSPEEYITSVTVHERVRRPQLPPERDGDD